jgi:nucleoside 2-deoxyribosyltransferase
MSIKIYICSGFFNEDQNKKLLIMLNACKKLNLDIYSPRDNFLYTPGKTDPQEVFEENLKQIKQSDMLLVSTAGKDMGALWECGYAYALDIPLVFYYPNGDIFNLMLSQSATAVLTSDKKLFNYLKEIKKTNLVPKVEYKGEIE